MMKGAIFFDRDGVLNELILNADTHEYESPHRPEDLALFSYTIPCLQELQHTKYDLFLVSNQPDYAKGNVTLETLYSIHNRLQKILTSRGIYFRAYYYCYHHPDGIVKEYSFDCECRKPKPFFLFQAKNGYSIELGVSWMVGDRDVDIMCGQAAGTKTILVEEPKSIKSRGNSCPDYKVRDLRDATRIILAHPL